MSAKGNKGCEKLQMYKECFKQADKDGNGWLDKEELRAMLRGEADCHLSDAELDEHFKFFEGPGGDRRITFEEFSKGLDIIMAFLEELVKIFISIDTDKSGFLERNEVKTVLQQSERGKQLTEKDIDDFIKAADVNGDNKIGLDEFLAAVC